MAKAPDIRDDDGSDPLLALQAVVDGVDDHCHVIRAHVLHGRFAEALAEARLLVRLIDGDVPTFTVHASWLDAANLRQSHNVQVRAMTRQIAKLVGERDIRLHHELGDIIHVRTLVTD